MYTDELVAKKSKNNDHEIMPGAGSIFGSKNLKSDLEKKQVAWIDKEYKNYLDELKAQAEERKAVEKQMKNTEKRVDKDAIDREVYAYHQNEAEKLERERLKKTELQHVMMETAPRNLQNQAYPDR